MILKDLIMLLMANPAILTQNSAFRLKHEPAYLHESLFSFSSSTFWPGTQTIAIQTINGHCTKTLTLLPFTTDGISTFQPCSFSLTINCLLFEYVQT